MTDSPSAAPRHWVEAGGATPAGVDAALRRAAATVLGVDPEELPPAEPRVAPARSGADRSSTLPMRISATPPDERTALADRIAADLRSDPWIDDAVVRSPGVVLLRLTPVAHASLVTAVGTGWDFLAGRTGHGRSRDAATGKRDSSRHGTEWARSAVERADSLATAHAWARDDAVRRLAAFLDAPEEVSTGIDPRGTVPPDTVSQGTDPPGMVPPVAVPPDTAPPVAPYPDTAPQTSPETEVTWRDPYQDAEPGYGPVARLLATIGEPAARVALCRSATATPRAGELTGPDLPARPTAEAPGAWVRLTDANPAFVLRHAHAHAHTTVARWAAGLGWEPGALVPPPTGAPIPATPTPAAVAALDRPEARAVLDVLFEGPGHVAAARRRAQPHVLVRYLERLAAAYHDWWTSDHVIPTGNDVVTGEGNDDRDDGATRTATAARLDLCAAVGGVLATGLFLLGVSAPTVL